VSGAIGSPPRASAIIYKLFIQKLPFFGFGHPFLKTSSKLRTPVIIAPFLSSLPLLLQPFGPRAHLAAARGTLPALIRRFLSPNFFPPNVVLSLQVDYSLFKVSCDQISDLFRPLQPPS